MGVSHNQLVSPFMVTTRSAAAASSKKSPRKHTQPPKVVAVKMVRQDLEKAKKAWVKQFQGIFNMEPGADRSRKLEESLKSFKTLDQRIWNFWDPKVHVYPIYLQDVCVDVLDVPVGHDGVITVRTVKDVQDVEEFFAKASRDGGTLPEHVLQRVAAKASVRASNGTDKAINQEVVLYLAAKYPAILKEELEHAREMLGIHKTAADSTKGRLDVAMKDSDHGRAYMQTCFMAMVLPHLRYYQDLLAKLSAIQAPK